MKVPLHFRASALSKLPSASVAAHTSGMDVVGHKLTSDTFSAPSALPVEGQQLLMRSDWVSARAMLPAAALVVAMVDPSVSEDAWLAAREAATSTYAEAKSVLSAAGAPVHCVGLWLTDGSAPRAAKDLVGRRLSDLRHSLGPDTPALTLLGADDLAGASSTTAEGTPVSPGPASSRILRVETALRSDVWSAIEAKQRTCSSSEVSGLPPPQRSRLFFFAGQAAESLHDPLSAAHLYSKCIAACVEVAQAVDPTRIRLFDAASEGRAVALWAVARCLHCYLRASSGLAASQSAASAVRTTQTGLASTGTSSFAVRWPSPASLVSEVEGVSPTALTAGTTPSEGVPFSVQPALVAATLVLRWEWMMNLSMLFAEMLQLNVDPSTVAPDSVSALSSTKEAAFRGFLSPSTHYFTAARAAMERRHALEWLHRYLALAPSIVGHPALTEATPTWLGSHPVLNPSSEPLGTWDTLHWVAHTRPSGREASESVIQLLNRAQAMDDAALDLLPPPSADAPAAAIRALAYSGGKSRLIPPVLPSPTAAILEELLGGRTAGRGSSFAFLPNKRAGRMELWRRLCLAREMLLRGAAEARRVARETEPEWGAHWHHPSGSTGEWTGIAFVPPCSEVDVSAPGVRDAAISFLLLRPCVQTLISSHSGADALTGWLSSALSMLHRSAAAIGDAFSAAQALWLLAESPAASAADSASAGWASPDTRSCLRALPLALKQAAGMFSPDAADTKVQRHVLASLANALIPTLTSHSLDLSLLPVIPDSAGAVTALLAASPASHSPGLHRLHCPVLVWSRFEQRAVARGDVVVEVVRVRLAGGPATELTLDTLTLVHSLPQYTVLLRHDESARSDPVELVREPEGHWVGRVNLVLRGGVESCWRIHLRAHFPSEAEAQVAIGPIPASLLPGDDGLSNTFPWSPAAVAPHLAHEKSGPGIGGAGWHQSGSSDRVFCVDAEAQGLPPPLPPLPLGSTATTDDLKYGVAPRDVALSSLASEHARAAANDTTSWAVGSSRRLGASVLGGPARAATVASSAATAASFGSPTDWAGSAVSRIQLVCATGQVSGGFLVTLRANPSDAGPGLSRFSKSDKDPSVVSLAERGGLCHTRGKWAAPAGKEAIARAEAALKGTAPVPDHEMGTPEFLGARSCLGTVRDLCRWTVWNHKPPSDEEVDRSDVLERVKSLEQSADQVAGAISCGIVIVPSNLTAPAPALHSDPKGDEFPCASVVPRQPCITSCILTDGLSAWEGSLQWATVVVTATNPPVGSAGDHVVSSVRFFSFVSSSRDIGPAIEAESICSVFVDKACLVRCAGEIDVRFAASLEGTPRDDGLVKLPAGAAVCIPPLACGGSAVLRFAVECPVFGASGPSVAALVKNPSDRVRLPHLFVQASIAAVGPISSEGVVYKVFGRHKDGLCCLSTLEAPPSSFVTHSAWDHTGLPQLEDLASKMPWLATTKASRHSWTVSPPLLAGLDLFPSGRRPLVDVQRLASSCEPGTKVPFVDLGSCSGMLGPVAPGDDATLVVSLSCPSCTPLDAMAWLSSPIAKALTQARSDSSWFLLDPSSRTDREWLERAQLFVPPAIPRAAVHCHKLWISRPKSGDFAPLEPCGGSRPTSVGDEVDLLGSPDRAALIGEASAGSAPAMSAAEAAGLTPSTLGASWAGVLRTTAKGQGDLFEGMDLVTTHQRVSSTHANRLIEMPVGSLMARWTEHTCGEGASVWRPPRSGEWVMPLPPVGVASQPVQVRLSCGVDVRPGDTIDALAQVASALPVTTTLQVAWGGTSVEVPADSVASPVTSRVEAVWDRGYPPGLVSMGTSRAILVLNKSECSLARLPLVALRCGIFVPPRVVLNATLPGPAGGGAPSETAPLWWIPPSANTVGSVINSKGARLPPILVA
jgi:hypothetical protein